MQAQHGGWFCESHFAPMRESFSASPARVMWVEEVSFAFTLNEDQGFKSPSHRFHCSSRVAICLHFVHILWRALCKISESCAVGPVLEDSVFAFLELLHADRSIWLHVFAGLRGYTATRLSQNPSRAHKDQSGKDVATTAPSPKRKLRGLGAQLLANPLNPKTRNRARLADGPCLEFGPGTETGRLADWAKTLGPRAIQWKRYMNFGAFCQGMLGLNNFSPTNGVLRIKPLKVKLLAGEQKATE